MAIEANNTTRVMKRGNRFEVIIGLICSVIARGALFVVGVSVIVWGSASRLSSSRPWIVRRTGSAEAYEADHVVGLVWVNEMRSVVGMWWGKKREEGRSGCMVAHTSRIS